MEVTIHHPPLDATMSKATTELYIKASKDELVSRLAKECIRRIDAGGGIGCTKEGVILVAKKILEICANV